MSIQQNNDRRHLHARDGPYFPASPFAAFWSAFTSEFGQEFATDSGAASTKPGSSLPAAQMTVTTTAVVTIPLTTVTIRSTLLETSFVTVPYTTGIVQPASTSSGNLPSASPLPSSIVMTGSSAGLSSSSSITSGQSTIPTVVTESSHSVPLTGSITLSLQTEQPMVTPSATAQGVTHRYETMHKHAIIGGLCGTVAGLVVLGLLVFFWLTRRRRQQQREGDTASDAASGSPEGSFTEKGLRPSIVRKWTELTGKGTPKQPPEPGSTSPVTVDEEHHIIRMSVQHWPRPYARGHGEGFRESVGPGQLRVMNPDQSRPQTPRMSSDTAGSFLRRQRSALAAVLLHGNRSKPSLHSKRDSIPSIPQIPEIQIDPALSQECIPANIQTPSFRSYPSASSLPVVRQQPPEDPFLTPPEESTEVQAQPRKKRPGLTPIQSAAGAAGRTLSNLGSALNPFRGRSNTATSGRAESTFSSQPSMRESTFSDPFDLDRPSMSIKASSSVQGRGRSVSELERGQVPFRAVYDGT
ncbi:hypothetical protein BAUCODRAFT_508776 [Baudoinia panamericana UAMH 10762]|uniref:Mid2 domain-containing protein n=1 Tax=Baudoinia panamericana (strain UAMH 10762) TaxID=717646 RepID=M2N9V3_BAUPA|nr:uncharacterized protein BAUCODRAFT_508776 [Baudoinia panamericana UAMH 10762]EMC95904.1 hypothetical protein BAUCODRAFT_508776 [Baudoinia panamericana UAMH 10762]